MCGYLVQGWIGTVRSELLRSASPVAVDRCPVHDGGMTIAGSEKTKSVEVCAVWHCESPCAKGKAICAAHAREQQRYSSRRGYYPPRAKPKLLTLAEMQRLMREHAAREGRDRRSA
jgi:hypothetical protein